ncbi:hypothetical protein [uncultured Chitinophaga sp.]|uniref:hypothetical protein n=1 Tax=uncultured Chitinophaga sp. TaxID=339340 RepID=UPI0025D790D5|nr:hypothetical protein [uncultured Chitinophaga sp.]
MTLILKKTSISLLSLFLFTLGTVAQQKAKVINVPMEPAYWQYDPAAGIKFIMHKGVKAVYVKAGEPLLLKDQQFSDGTIEYDVEFGFGFPGITFHLSADGKTGDNFYLRYFKDAAPAKRTTLQYTAMVDSTNLWDLADEYQAGARLNIPGWNHIKLVVSGKQMKAYVNDMTRHALLVPSLEGGVKNGGIAFSGGEITIANMVIKPGAVENLDPSQGYIPVYNDTRYLRKWQCSPAIEFPFGKEIAAPLPYLGGKLICPEYPDSSTKWTPLVTEDRALLNLTRALGGTPFKTRRLAWVKTTIESDSAQERNLHLGFSDEIWLFVNGQAVYADKNHFGSPGQKFPSGRCTIENTVVRLPLQKGRNEVLIAVANYFYGWGIIARLDEMEGVRFPE